MNRIVVGVDGSPGAQVALRWAVREARLRGATVDVVHAWEPPTWFALAAGGRAEFTRLHAELEEAANEVVDAALRTVGRDATDVPIQRIVVEESPAAALLSIARHADLLVVGSRALGGVRRVVLGSVSSRCIAHSPCPVVVIPSSDVRDVPLAEVASRSA